MNSATLPPAQVLGVMSGTSLDGIDAVLARFERREGRLAWEVLARFERPYAPELKRRLEAAIRPESSNVQELTQLHTEVGEAYAELVSEAMRSASIDLVALSGQTLYHIPRTDPALGWRTVSTLQIGEAARVTERCRVAVASDFRQSDMAAGGQGAPMVSFGDLQLFAELGTARSVHNLGGISNLTYLPADSDPERVLAFDTGPANCLIDEAMQARYGRPYDEGGAVAAAGTIDQRALADLLTHPYFAQPLPKTTGREAFYLDAMRAITDLDALADADLIATLTALSAESIAGAYRDVALPLGLDEVLVAGGGALNPTLIAMLRARLPLPLRTFEQIGWRSKDREALAFGVMGYFALHGLPNTLPSATGAERSVIAGKLSRPPDRAG
jgi:anhydro-N-acetylmuramic acid kinase